MRRRAISSESAARSASSGRWLIISSTTGGVGAASSRGRREGPICFVAALGRALDVLEVRLARGLRASPRIWALLGALPGASRCPRNSLGGLPHEMVSTSRSDSLGGLEIFLGDLLDVSFVRRSASHRRARIGVWAVLG